VQAVDDLQPSVQRRAAVTFRRQCSVTLQVVPQVLLDEFKTHVPADDAGLDRGDFIGPAKIVSDASLLIRQGGHRLGLRGELASRDELRSVAVP
jgi:hypothetical protein